MYYTIITIPSTYTYNLCTDVPVPPKDVTVVEEMNDEPIVPSMIYNKVELIYKQILYFSNY